MYQFYVLSIITTILAGVTVSYEWMDERLKIGAFFGRDGFTNPTFRLVLGLVAIVVGFFKILTVTGTNVPVVGDLVPALAGMAVGFILLLQYYLERTKVSSATISTLETVFVKNGVVFGLVAIAAGVAHFLFHGTLFL